ncbi:MAG: hypothetical protein LQ347_006179 [Umbilicaria vellea]|nr:MAG: hypothetical protein LQ347_006179 [Umbilicaria vellea]
MPPQPTSSGATYDSIEGRFRIIKREATALKTEAESITGAVPVTEIVKDELDGHDIISRAQIATPKKGRTPKNPTKKENGTLGGRVSKSANATPTKQRKAGAVKNVVRGVKEEVLSSGSSMTEEGMMSGFGTQEMEMGMEDWGMGGAGAAVCGASNGNAFQGMMMGSSGEVRVESFDMV